MKERIHAKAQRRKGRRKGFAFGSAFVLRVFESFDILRNRAIPAAAYATAGDKLVGAVRIAVEPMRALRAEAFGARCRPDEGAKALVAGFVRWLHSLTLIRPSRGAFSRKREKGYALSALCGGLARRADLVVSLVEQDVAAAFLFVLR